MIAEHELQQAVAPVLDKIEHDLAVFQLRITRLRMALEFIRHYAGSEATKLYAESALESDDVMS